MAFNFNWSPLMADSDFYSRAKELLTTALNKSPKPPIIVDDIIVNDLDLGSVPPELEILEIGDLADDRFRGIFKMCYSGDAFLTLKTRVQANPLNTYLSTRPSFTSPQPLAASSGLTIPLQITLSEFKLSAFIILVFSKQKGLTLVFRNDPLESMVVSSTFDSIPFVRDYLQKVIEGQLRVLLMEEVPAIIHRLSLRLWVPDHLPQQMNTQTEATRLLDTVSSPAQDAVFGDLEPSFLSLETNFSDDTSSFSPKNLARLAEIHDSNRTLSLFTLQTPEAVFRAWAGASERATAQGINTPYAINSPPLKQVLSGNIATMYSFSEASSSATSLPLRPSLQSFGSSANGLSLGAGRHSRSHLKKKKNRVINLRQSRSVDGSVADSESVSGDSETSEPPMTWHSNPLESDSLGVPPSIVEENEDSSTPQPKTRMPANDDAYRSIPPPSPLRINRPATPPSNNVAEHTAPADLATQTTPKAATERNKTVRSSFGQRTSAQEGVPGRMTSYFAEKGNKYSFNGFSSSSSLNHLASHAAPPSFTSLDQCQSSSSRTNGGLASPSMLMEQAYVYKLANELARQRRETEGDLLNEKGTRRHGGSYEDAPPAYAAQ